MESEKQVEIIRNQLIELGREVAVQHTTTQFPDWCLFKIGIHKVQGLPYDGAYYEALLESTLNSNESD
ncbi:hypothetical protein CN637_03855 [Bacillus toyonensis]|uniref:hypothetical protein n=1 Tax=Bacillus toyonensis TaxID=155322 RepID=UPI000BEF8B22|nr:hypothetical protein [Bacillus toyonensis]PEL71143.1 hypothetical protein CN637_03855 [Bacillus toyonensis]